jgi:hypothetical protein
MAFAGDGDGKTDSKQHACLACVLEAEKRAGKDAELVPSSSCCGQCIQYCACVQPAPLPPEHDETGLDPKEIETVELSDCVCGGGRGLTWLWCQIMDCTGATRSRCVAALRKFGNPVDAMLDLEPKPELPQEVTDIKKENS